MKRSQILAILFLSVMLVGLIALPAGHRNRITNEEIAEFGETQPDGTLYYPDTGTTNGFTEDWDNIENWDSQFLPSGDGDISSDSITSFAETLADDTPLDPDSDTNADAVYSEWDFSETLNPDILYYPDGYDNSTSFAVAGGGIGTLSGTYERTFVSDDVDFMSAYSRGAGAGIEEHAIDLYCNYTIPTASSSSFDYYFTLEYSLSNYLTAEFIDGNITIYNWTSSSWELLHDDDDFVIPDAWLSFSISDGFLGSESSNNVWIKITLVADMPAYTGIDIYWDYGTILTNLNTRDGYTESFADVSDWTASIGDAPTSDDDVMILEPASDGTFDKIYTNVPSITNDLNYYYEYRVKANATSTTYIQFYGYESDGASTTSHNFDSYAVTTSWVTRSGIITHDGTLESISCLFKSSVASQIIVDYLGIGTVNGWGHDGSTTEGVSDDSEASWNYQYSSDGDTLNITATRLSGGDNYGHVFINYDTTTTPIDLESSYYSWTEINWECSYFNMSGNAIQIYPYLDAGGPVWAEVYASGFSAGGTFSQRTNRINNVEGTTGFSNAYIDVQFYSTAIGEDATILINYTRIYGFNNWTYLDDSNTLDNPTESVAYYDSSEDALVMSADFSTGQDWWRLNTRNTSIGYSTTDMVIGITVKASANNSAKLRIWQSITGDTDLGTSYYLFDDYQTIWIPCSTTSHVLDNFLPYIWDWNNDMADDVSIYIKNNITIRPSWYDASGESISVESFANVSDILIDGIESEDGESFTSDGDLGTLEASYSGSSEYDGFGSNGPSGYYDYFELRYRVNTTSGYQINFATYDGDDWITNNLWIALPRDANSAWRTYKLPIYRSLESWRFTLYLNTEGIQVKADIDYILFANSTEMGYQDDCSGVSITTGTGGIIYSDGNNIELSSTVDGREFAFRTSSIDPDLYPFLEIGINSVSDGDGDNLVWRPRIYDGTDYFYLSDTKIGTSGVFRYNIRSLTSLNIEILYLYIDDSLDTFSVNYTKFYSIANWTHSQHPLAETSDLYYVSNGALIRERGTARNDIWLTLNYDPVLSITTDVWNMSVSGFSDALTTWDYGFKQYNGAWQSWDYDTTRGAVYSGTVTDMQILTFAEGTISNIKFIEDGTAPSVVRSWANPEPSENVEVTLSAVITDAIEVYKIYYDPIVYPVGFSDIAYYATEQTDNLWTYTFTSLASGHYTFKIVATDGANQNELTEYAYIDFQVIEVEAESNPFILNDWQIFYLDTYINVDRTTSWGNSTLDAYDNGTLVATGNNENATLQITKSTVVGVHVLSFSIDGGNAQIWKNGSAYEIAQPAVTFGNMAISYRTTASPLSEISFLSMNTTLSYDSTTIILSDSVVNVPITSTFNISVRNIWGVEIYTETFNYSSHKWIQLPFYEVILENQADHLVRIDLSYNATETNITVMIGQRSNRLLLLDPAVYLITFTYYDIDTTPGAIVDFYQETGYYVAYTVNVSGPGGLMYSGIPLSDIQENIDAVDGNVDQEGEDTRLTILGVEARTSNNGGPSGPLFTWDSIIIILFILLAILGIVSVIRAIKNDGKEKSAGTEVGENEIVYT